MQLKPAVMLAAAVVVVVVVVAAVVATTTVTTTALAAAAVETTTTTTVMDDLANAKERWGFRVADGEVDDAWTDGEGEGDGDNHHHLRGLATTSSPTPATTSFYGFFKVPTNPFSCNTAQPKNTWKPLLGAAFKAGICYTGGGGSFRFTCNANVQKVTVFSDASCTSAVVKTLGPNGCDSVLSFSTASMACLPVASLVRFNTYTAAGCAANTLSNTFVLPKDGCLAANPSSPTTKAYAVLRSSVAVSPTPTPAPVPTFSFVYTTLAPETCSPANAFLNVDTSIAGMSLFGKINTCQRADASSWFKFVGA